MYDPDEVKPAPTSWDVVFDNAGDQRQGDGLRQPDRLADAALYLRDISLISGSGPV